MRPRNAATEYSENGQSALSGDASRLIEVNLPYARALAAEVMRKLPPDLDKKDIQRWAELGLVEAANSFDPTRGVQFRTFAHYRIKGAIYDGLRKMGWYPKGQYQRMRFEMAANGYMEDVSAEPATARSEYQDLKDITGNLVTCYMLSLEAIAEEPVDEAQVSAEQVVLQEQQRKNVRKCIAQLPEKNRRVLEYCYFDELTFEEIGQKLNLSKSWVCRIHAKSLELLRRLLTKDEKPNHSSSPQRFIQPADNSKCHGRSDRSEDTDQASGSNEGSGRDEPYQNRRVQVRQGTRPLAG